MPFHASTPAPCLHPEAWAHSPLGSWGGLSLASPSLDLAPHPRSLAASGQLFPPSSSENSLPALLFFKVTSLRAGSLGRGEVHLLCRLHPSPPRQWRKLGAGPRRSEQPLPGLEVQTCPHGGCEVGNSSEWKGHVFISAILKADTCCTHVRQKRVGSTAIVEETVRSAPRTSCAVEVGRREKGGGTGPPLAPSLYQKETPLQMEAILCQGHGLAGRAWLDSSPQPALSQEPVCSEQPAQHRVLAPGEESTGYGGGEGRTILKQLPRFLGGWQCQQAGTRYFLKIC